MRTILKLGLPVFSLLFCSVASALTPDAMVNRILQVGENTVQSGNIVEFDFKGLKMMLVFDESADRMRLVSPIAEVKNIGDDLLFMALEANFHSALDARYAISNNVVWSVFIHPLDDLSADLFDSAISQVAIAHATFGSDFTSGALVFPSGSGE